jgi:hypothetical protein
MFTTFSHKGNTNQNHTEIPSQNGNHHKNKQQQILVSIQGEKGTLIYYQ